MATARSLEERVAALEEVARLKAKVETPNKGAAVDWLDVVWGSFANDPMYEEAMRLGREWRESFRPKPRRRRKKR